MRGLYTIVGMKHRDKDAPGTSALVAALPKDEPLVLVHEPKNPHDPNAVQVWARNRHIGFVKGTQARDAASWIAQHGFNHTLPQPVLPVSSFATANDESIEVYRAVHARLAVTAERWPCAEAIEHAAPAPKPTEPAKLMPLITEGRDVSDRSD